MKRLKCPICGKLPDEKSPFRPFCSDRCRTIDLAKWANEEYVVSAPLDPEALAEGLRDQASLNLGGWNESAELEIPAHEGRFSLSDWKPNSRSRPN